MRRVLNISIASFVAIVAFAVSVFLLNRNLGKGALQVTSEPVSRVYLNGKLIGQTPLCKCEFKDMLDVGSYNIRLVPIEGNFVPFEQKIPINQKVLTVVDRSFEEGGQSSGSIISLEKLSNKNEISLSVVSIPQGSKLLLDLAEIGKTPVRTSDITESDHEIKLAKEGYKDKFIKIRTAKGYLLNAVVFLGANPIMASPPSSAAPAPSLTKILILDTPTGFLRVRDSASLSGNEIGRVLPGEKFDLLDEQSGWFKIKLKDGSSGWVSSQYSQKQS